MIERLAMFVFVFLFSAAVACIGIVACEEVSKIMMKKDCFLKCIPNNDYKICLNACN